MSLDPTKTYLEWNGTTFPNSALATFKAPAGSTIDWGDGTFEEFQTASTTRNEHTYDDGKTEHTIAISGLTYISNDAFSNCSSLTSVTIPDSVKSIGDNTFRSCNSLTSVTIGNSVTSIGNNTFRDCGSLTSVTIGNSVTSIGDWSFSNCSSLTSVTIPDSVKSIGWGAFWSCDNLMSVTIGNSVTSISNNAFAYSIKLRQLILFKSTPPTLGSNAIPSTIQSIYVQQSSKAAYQNATNWTTFADKIVSDNLYLSFVRFNQKNKEYIDDKVKESEQCYRHSISYLGTSDEGVIVKIYLTVVSRTSLVVDSLSALKVLIGNTFTYSATGAVLKTLQQELYQVIAITDTQVKTIFNSGFIDINYPTGKWSDDVTTV